VTAAAQQLLPIFAGLVAEESAAPERTARPVTDIAWEFR
jgi:hypothetical protein